MIRYAATSTGMRAVRARSLVALNGGANSCCRYKSSPARQEEPWENNALEQPPPPHPQPPRFQPNKNSPKRNQHHPRETKRVWRGDANRKETGLSDFFSRRRQPAESSSSIASRQRKENSSSSSIPRITSSPPSFASIRQQPQQDQQSNSSMSPERPAWRRAPTTNHPASRRPSFSSTPGRQRQPQRTLESNDSPLERSPWRGVPSQDSVPRRNNRNRQQNSNLRHRPVRNHSPPPSFRSKQKLSPAISSNALNNNSSKENNMADVSDLREAFLKSIKSHYKREPKDKIATPRKPAAPLQKPAWRKGGAKAFRQQQQQRRKEEKEKKAKAWRLRQSVNTLFQTQGKKPVSKSSSSVEHTKQVILPKGGGDVSLLTSRLRVSKQRVVNILKDLGETHADQDGYHVDVDTMELVALELGMEPVRDTRRGARHVEDDRNLLLQRRAAAGAEEETAVANASEYASFPPRPPVVACMGHVDHGKTTLMDALRRRSNTMAAKTSKSKKKKSKKSKSAAEKGDIAGTEAGGITQVISAFQILLEDSERAGAVTFLDTPGHAAFTSMRESGSHAADVIVLVVAADDGVSPQTVEILNFYKTIIQQAGSGAISLVVAMTKIDKPGIDVDESRMRIENQLLEHGIVTENMASSDEEEEFGPPVQLIPVSGLTGDGLDDLIEGLELQSEVMDLRADQKATAEGIVMDARIEKGLGVVADCIVRWGSLERGNAVVSGVHSGKVKVLQDVNGKALKKGMPSQPVRIIGFESLPKAGDPVICVSSEEKAKRLVEKRQEVLESNPTATFRTDYADDTQFQVTGTASKTASMQQMAEDKYEIDDDSDDKTIRIPVIIKADADGTLAAVRDSLLEVGNMSSAYNLIVDPVGMGIGPILSSDLALAQQSGAAIFSFGLDKLNDKSTIHMAEGEGVVIRSHNVIYSLLDDAKDVFATHLPLAPVEVVHGSATVQAVFDINNKSNAERIAGLKVMDGTLYKRKVDGSKLNCHYRVFRNGEMISPEGETVTASSLRRVKENVEDVRRGEECGLGLDGFDGVQEGDTIECYSIEMKRVFV